MRFLACLLIASGVLLLAHAGFDQFRGRTRSPIDVTATVEPKDSDEFHRAMAYRWVQATALLTAGVILRRIVRAQERSDPLSSDFAGTPAVDAWGDSLRSEADQRHRP